MTTKAEKKWMDDITRIGCIVCYNQGHPQTPGVVHHILKNGRRQSHLQTICLCEPGHHQNGKNGKISRHPNKARFEAEYGTEQSLLEQTRGIVECAAY